MEFSPRLTSARSTLKRSLAPWKPNSGFAAAANQGLAASRGAFVLFLNPDAVVHEGTIARALAHLVQRELRLPHERRQIEFDGLRYAIGRRATVLTAALMRVAFDADDLPISKPLVLDFVANLNATNIAFNKVRVYGRYGRRGRFVYTK